MIAGGERLARGKAGCQTIFGPSPCQAGEHRLQGNAERFEQRIAQAGDARRAAPYLSSFFLRCFYRRAKISDEMFVFALSRCFVRLTEKGRWMNSCHDKRGKRR